MRQKTEDSRLVPWGRARSRQRRRRQKTEWLRQGSALILAVVLTSLLAIIGVIFLLSSRVDSVATSGISDNKDLGSAVDTVIAKISEDLSVDVMRGSIDPNQYCDYPDPCNPWLACLEPYYKSDTNDYYWRQVSNIYGPAVQIVKAQVLPDYNNTFAPYTEADADGDGVSDSFWMQVPDINSSKGKPIYVAIRIIDNGGMLNVNTGYKFDPNTSDGSSQVQINLLGLAGRDYTHISPGEKEARLLSYRCSSASANLYEQNVVWQYGLPAGVYIPFDISDELKLRNRYILNYNLMTSRIEKLWTNAFDGGIGTPAQSLTDPCNWFWKTYNSYPAPCPNPDVYDYRHIATIQNLDRIIDPNGDKMLNINRAPQIDPNYVRNTIANALAAGGVLPADANALGAQITANLIDYRDDDSNVTVVYDSDGNPHFGFERPCIYISEIAQNFFEPNEAKPDIVERSYAIELYKPYAEDPYPGIDCPPWQLAIFNPVLGTTATFDVNWSGSGRFHVLLNDNYDVIKIDLNDINGVNDPYPLDGARGVTQDVNLSWPAVSTATSYNIYFGTDYNAVYYATTTSDPCNVYKGNFTARTYDPPGLLDMSITYYWRIDPVFATITLTGRVWRFTVSEAKSQPAPLLDFNSANLIELRRRVPDGSYVTVDSILVPTADINPTGWLKPEVNDSSKPELRNVTHSFQRDIFPHKPIRRLWDFAFDYIDVPSIGYLNSFEGDSPQVQAHPANQQFTNVGEFGQLFYNNTYAYGGILLPLLPVLEANLRINLALPEYQQVFKYLTVMNPFDHGADVNETRIKGRININTAPWFVIAQLPWLSQKIGQADDANLARSIISYRDKININIAGVVDYSGRAGSPGFKTIGELMNVNVASADPNSSIFSYKNDGIDLLTFPDLTPNDGAIDDFEERDAIFARISNLVTVRSDVFTAYILVRIGPDGPQKRVVAILDRSGVTPAGGKVRILAIQQVPDAR